MELPFAYLACIDVYHAPILQAVIPAAPVFSESILKMTANVFQDSTMMEWMPCVYCALNHAKLVLAIPPIALLAI